MMCDTESPDVNTPRGRLELSSKTYTVYDGLNTVGRNPGAVVNIKNLNISQQHAIITIIDRNTHFISDFKSSNGTTLNNKKLQPLKLYKLNHGASIKFADVHCTYKKVETNEDILDNWEATQDFSESFYSTNTQTVHLNNSNKLNIHEMPTQALMPPPSRPKTVSINELPTQVCNWDDYDFNNHDDVMDEKKNGSKASTSNKSPVDDSALDMSPPPSINEIPSTALSINELPTQVYNFDDSECQNLNATSGASKILTPSRALNTQGPAQSSASNVLEESRHDSSSDSIDFMTMQKISESQAVCLGNEDKAEDVTPNQCDSEPVIQPVKLNSSKNVLSTDSEGGQSTPEVMQPSEQREEAALSQICPVKIGTKQVIASDSEENEDSDTEEYVPRKERRSRYVISDDSETDIEDTEDNKCNNTTLNNTDVIPSTQEVVNKKSETLNSSQPLEKAETLNTSQPLEKSETFNTSQPLENSSMNSFRLEISELDNVEEPKVEQEPVAGTSLKDVIAEDHIYCSRPNSQQIEEPMKGNSMEDHIYCKSPDDETQKSVEQASDQQQEEKVDENNIKDQVDEAETKEKNNAEVSAVKTVEEVDKALSQKENESGDNVNKKITEANSRLKDEDETLSVMGDEDSNPLTEDFIPSNIQKEEEKNLTEEKISPNGVEKSDKEEKKQDDEDIFEQPTQLDFISDKKKVNYKSDDDVFLQPTQKMIGGSEKDEIDDDFYIQQTQRINEVDKKAIASETSDEDVYFQPTQQLVAPVEEKISAKDHEFARPFQRFSEEKASTSKKIEDDDDFLPPTQALEILHKEDKPDQPENLSNQNSNSSEVEDQMEMMFYSQSDERFNATQQLVDVLENSDIIEDSMLEDNRGTLKTAEFSTNDSVRMILDDFDDDDDDDDKLNKMEKNVEKNEKANSKKIANKKENDKAVLNIVENKNPNNKIKDTEECPVSDNKFKNNKTLRKKLDENQLKEEMKDTNSAARTSNRRDQKTEEVAEKSQKHKDEVLDTDTSRKLSKDNNERKMEKKESQGSTDETKDCGNKTRRKLRNNKANEETDPSTSKEGNLVVTDASTNVSKGKAGRKTEKKKSDSSNDETEDNGTRTRRKLRNVVLENLDEVDEEASTSVRKKTLKSSNTEDENKNMTGSVSRTRTKKEKTPDNSEESVNLSETPSISKLSTRKRTKESENVEEDIRKKQDSKVSKKGNTRTMRKREESVASNSSDKSEKIEENDNVRTRRKRGEKKEDSEVSSNSSSKTEDNNEQLVSTARKRTLKSSTLTITDFKDKDRSKDIKTISEIENTPKAISSRTRQKREGSVASDTSARMNQASTSTASRTRQKKEGSVASDTLEKINQPNASTVSKTRQKRESSVASDTSERINQPNTSTASRTRQKREGSVTSDTSERMNQLSTSTASTRKRNLKTSELDSEDEFEPSPILSSPKKKKITTPQVVETPSIRKSERTRKPKLFNDEAVSSQDDVVSVASTSSANEEPPKKTRRLSANSRALKNEQVSDVKGKQISNQNASVLATPERSKRQLKPKVVFTMMDSPELESLIRQLGGSVVDTVDACTVLVTESVKRSQKLLCAVGQSKPICSPHWLQACKKAHTFLDPWDYILVDKEAEKKWNFSLQESLRRSAGIKLLENHTFHIVVNNAADVIKGAIEACGGKCVTRNNLAKADTNYKYIISEKDCKAKYSKIVKSNPGIEVVEKEAIFDGTLRQEFRFNDYLIT